MKGNIRPVARRRAVEALDFVEKVFAEAHGAEEGKFVRRLVEEIRAKGYYLPELELVMEDARGDIMGYAMFSRFHIEGRYEDALLILTPVAVRTELQRQHISREIIEFGFERAKELGYRAVLVEGDPRNYRARGFVTAAEHGILPGESVHLPAIECLMVKKLVPGALEEIHGVVDYGFYETLAEEGKE